MPVNNEKPCNQSEQHTGHMCELDQAKNLMVRQLAIPYVPDGNSCQQWAIWRQQSVRTLSQAIQETNLSPTRPTASFNGFPGNWQYR